MLLQAELNLALDLARQGGAMALQMQHDLTVSHKPHGLGPVSDADLAIDQLICKKISQTYPHDLIISEESFVGESVSADHQRVWFIDPIDGTSSYIVGREDFVIMIGLAIEGHPAMGVVYQPAQDIMWYGLNWSGMRVCQKVQKGQACSIDLAKTPNIGVSSTLKLLISRTSRSKKQSALIEQLAPAGLLSLGSIGLKAMTVLSGEADLYVCWSARVSLWDTCAPQAIMAGAGGVFSFIDGSALSYSGAITHGGAIMAARIQPEHDLLLLLKQIDEQHYPAS